MKIDIASEMINEFKSFYKDGVEPKLDNFVADGFAKAREGKQANKTIRMD